MRKFDYSFLNNALLPAKLINLTASIASLKTMAGVRKQEYAKVDSKEAVRLDTAQEEIIVALCIIEEKYAAYQSKKHIS